MIHNPQVAGPARFATLLLLAIAGLGLGYLALGLTADERGLMVRSSVVNRTRGELRRERRSFRERPVPVAPPRSRPTVAVSEPAKTVIPAGRQKDRKAAVAQTSWRSVTTGSCRLLNSYRRRRRKVRQQIDRVGLERNARLLKSVLEDFNVRARSSRSGRARSSQCTNSSPRAGSRQAG